MSMDHLLNKSYVNEVTLTNQNQDPNPLKIVSKVQEASSILRMSFARQSDLIYIGLIQ